MSMGHKTHAKQPKAAMGIDLQSSNYGSCLPVLFGQNKVPPIVGWYGDFKAIPHKQKQQGSKGGGGQSTTSYTYQASWLALLIEGAGSLVNVFNGTTQQSLSSLGGTFSSGTFGQAPWAHLTGTAAIGYSLTAWVAFQNYNLGDNASLPNFNYEMVGKNQYNATIKDANPADIVTTICTDPYVGVHFNALGDLTQFSNYCRAAGIFFSPLYNTQQQASQPLEDIFKYANSAAFFSEGVLKVVPYGDATITGNGATYTPNLTAVADLGPNDFITNGSDAPVRVSRKAPADARNIHRIEFKDRANSYHSNAVQASIDQDVNANGARSDNSDSVDMITQASIARLVAQNLVQRDFYIRNSYEFQLSWRYCYLEPMDIVTLTDANTGLSLTPVRITEITEDEHGLLQITAEEMPDGIGHGGSYSTQSNLHVPVDQNTDPGPVDGPYLFRAPGFLVSAGAPEIWAAISGSGQYWAGCHVYISTDNASFEFLTTFARKSTYGYLTNAITAGTDLDAVNVPNVTLNAGMTLRGGNATDRDEFNTMSMIDTEVISYMNAALAAGPSYNLSSLRRGGFGTTMNPHAINAPFVRLDENILRIPIGASQVGKTVYFKFLSFNCFGMGGRSLASETSYAYTIGSNVEFPDQPVTPANFLVTPVVDGSNITWSNPNPAAVACTSLEYSPNVGGPWTVLGQEGPTATGYHHAHTTGNLYYYRARSRGHQIQGGWSAYTSVLSSRPYVIGGRGMNILWDEYTRFNNPRLPSMPANDTAHVTCTYDSTVSLGSGTGGSMKCAINDPTGTITNNYIRFANSTGDYPVKLEGGKKYIISANFKGSAAGQKIAFYVKTSDAVVTRAADITTSTSFARYSSVLDLSAYAPGAIDAGHVGAYLNRHGATTAFNVWTDEWMIEEMVGANTNPSTWSTGNPGRLVDGKISHYWLATAPYTSGGVEGDQWTDTDTMVTSRWSVSAQVWQTMSAFSSTAAGDNLVPNSAFSLNNLNVTNGAGLALNAYACDAWKVIYDYTKTAGQPSSATFISLNPSATGGSGLFLQVGNPTSLANGALVAAQVISDPFPVAASTVYFAQFQAYLNANGTTNANVIYQNRLSVFWYDSTGAQIGAPVTPTWLDRSTGLGLRTSPEVAVTSPAGACTARITMDVYVKNNTGAAWSHDSTVALYAFQKWVKFSRKTDLEIGGSGRRLGDTGNVPMIMVGNGVAKVPTVITYTSAAGTPATATISVAAFTVLSGSRSIAYNAMSVGVSHAAGTVTYFLYFDDAAQAGGSQTLVATTTGNTVWQADGRVYVGTVDVVFPSSGTGGGSGSGGGGPNSCVCIDQYLGEEHMAMEAQVGDLLDCIDIPTSLSGYRAPIQAVRFAETECVRLITEGGAKLDLSSATPFDLLDGRTCEAELMKDEYVITDKGIEKVVTVLPLGIQPVARISVGGVSYAAGHDPKYRIYSHNVLKP